MFAFTTSVAFGRLAEGHVARKQTAGIRQVARNENTDEFNNSLSCSIRASTKQQQLATGRQTCHSEKQNRHIFFVLPQCHHGYETINHHKTKLTSKRRQAVHGKVSEKANWQVGILLLSCLVSTHSYMFNSTALLRTTVCTFHNSDRCWFSNCHPLFSPRDGDISLHLRRKLANVRSLFVLISAHTPTPELCLSHWLGDGRCEMQDCVTSQHPAQSWCLLLSAS